jgi:hypothetical protein
MGRMDLHELLDLLDLPRGDRYYASRIPCPADDRVGRAVAAFSAASPPGQAAVREAIDDDRADLLRAWSERLASLGVRLDSGGPLVQGLVGLSLAEEADPAEAMLVATLHRRSAEKLDLQADRIFDAAAGRTDLSGARWLRDARDAPEQPEDAGWIEDEDADGFRYGRAAALRSDR